MPIKSHAVALKPSNARPSTNIPVRCPTLNCPTILPRYYLADHLLTCSPTTVATGLVAKLAALMPEEITMVVALEESRRKAIARAGPSTVFGPR
jgi:hypothetical protein